MKQRNISKGIYSLYVIMFMLMIPIGDLWAQDPLNISGKVVDVNNEPLIGATVQVKGKQTGTITNIEGRFSVKVQAKDILVISYMGYTSQEMIASKANGATITLVEDGKTLEEVVVVGYVQSPNQKIPDRKTKCVIKTHINIKQNVIFGAKLKPV